MSNDGLRRLPDHVVAALLRALMTIRHRPESRLYLRKCVPHRIHMTEEDYRVFATIHDDLPREEPVGNIWLDPAPETLEAKIAPWRWAIDTTRGGTNKDGWWSRGRSRTRDEAMAAFRNAWDSYQPKKSAPGP